MQLTNIFATIGALAATASAVAVVAPVSSAVDGALVERTSKYTCNPGYNYCPWGGLCLEAEVDVFVGLGAFTKGGKKCHRAPDCSKYARDNKYHPNMVTSYVARSSDLKDVSYFGKERCDLDLNAFVFCGLKVDIDIDVDVDVSVGGLINIDIDVDIEADISLGRPVRRGRHNQKTCDNIVKSLISVYIKDITAAVSIWNKGSCGLTRCECLHHPERKSGCKNVVVVNKVRKAISLETLNGCGLLDGVFHILSGVKILVSGLGCLLGAVLSILGLGGCGLL